MTITDQNEKRFQGLKDKTRQESDKDVRRISSAVLTDGTILEMLLGKETGTSSLAIFKNEELTIKNTYRDGDVVYKPHQPNKELFTNNVILLPSEPAEYDSQQKLIDEIKTFIHKYLLVSEFFEKIASYYVLFSWVYDDFNELPYLRGLGGYGTGKSRLLKTIGSICYCPIITSGVTTVSPIFRILNDYKGTLVLDEADLRYSDTTNDLIKIINQGFMKDVAVLRCVGDNKQSFDVKSYNVYGPKLLATRKLFQDEATESRMITEDMNMNDTKERDDIPYNLPESFDKEALSLRNKLLMFRLRTKGKNKIKSDLENRDIEPRLNQIAVPLMSIIDDEDIIKDIQSYILKYNDKIKVDRTLGYDYQILDAICSLLDNNYEEPTIKEVTEEYNKDLSASEIITPKKMGYLLRKMLDIKTAKTRNGYIILKENKDKLEKLRKRYGIIDNREHVNVENDDSDSKQATVCVEDIFN